MIPFSIRSLAKGIGLRKARNEEFLNRHRCLLFRFDHSPPAIKFVYCRRNATVFTNQVSVQSGGRSADDLYASSDPLVVLEYPPTTY